MTISGQDLPGQFILGKTPEGFPSGWPVRSLGVWHLATHPRLPVVEIVGADSSALGWLLGWPISPAGRLVHETLNVPVSGGGLNRWSAVESAVYAHGGRYAAILPSGDGGRVYLDPIGSLAMVYSPQQRLAASTSTLIPVVGDSRDDADDELIAVSRDPSFTDGYFPFGSTHRRSVRRVLPNHYLDLAAWTIRRHWPAGEIAPVRDTAEAVRELAGLLKLQIEAVAREHGLHMSLTAGRDSRMLLACARQLAPDVVFYTFTMPNNKSWVDPQVGRKLAKRFRLRYRFLPYEPASTEELAEWDRRTGRCISRMKALPIRMQKRLDSDRSLILGVAGEVGRGFHWRDGDREDTPLRAEDLLNKRGIPLNGRVIEMAQRWLADLPVRNALTIWGLMYNESFNGCWFAPQHYGNLADAPVMCPFSHRRIMELMMALPTPYRRDNRLPEDVIGLYWPELLQLPFNWPIGFGRYVYAARWRLAALRRKLTARAQERSTG